MAATTWVEVDSLIHDLDGWFLGRYGSCRHYRVPSETGGTLQVDVTLRPRWCTIGIDRWNTTDYAPDGEAATWLKEHVWPLVMDAQSKARRRGLWGTLPGGDGTCSYASPIERDRVLPLLCEWLPRETHWGAPAGEEEL